MKQANKPFKNVFPISLSCSVSVEIFGCTVIGGGLGVGRGGAWVCVYGRQAGRLATSHGWSIARHRSGKLGSRQDILFFLRAGGAAGGRTPGAIKMVTPCAFRLSLCPHQPEQKFRLLYVFVYLSGVSLQELADEVIE